MAHIIDLIKTGYLGRHKREFLKTHKTSYIKTHCCFCSFLTEKTIWILTLFSVRLSMLCEVKKLQNDWSSINFHYSGPQKAQLVDPEFKIQVTQGVQNIQTRAGTPCTKVYYVLVLFSILILKCVQVMVHLHNFPIFSFLAKMLSFLLQKRQHFCQKWKYWKNMQADHNLNGL